MTGFLSAIIIVLLLGVLITVHELGHFFAARICGIRVREFASGMGPAFFRKKRKTDADGYPSGTKFSLRVFPIGGFCDMGEDEDSEDPSHFRNKNNWQKAFVLVSGALMNLLLGFFIFLVLSCVSVGRVTDRIPYVAGVSEDCPYDFKEGDLFYRVNGHRIYSDTDFLVFMPAADDANPVDFVLLRNGEKITLPGLTRQVETQVLDENNRPVLDEDGKPKTAKKFGFSYGFTQNVIRLSDVPRQTVTMTFNSVRMVWYSLGQLITGKAGIGDLMGPVGMGSVVNSVISEPRATSFDMLYNILMLAGLVAANLAVVNLLPIPGLDGGRVIFLLISAFLVLVRKKPLSAKVEGYIHGVTLLLLFALMLFIFFGDIRRIVGL